MDNSIPPLSEFISLQQRHEKMRPGFPAMRGQVTVAVYRNRHGNYHTVAIRISEDIAKEHGLIEGARLSCFIHPDQRHIALTPGKGASLFRPKKGRALVYQTTVREGTLEPQPATPASVAQQGAALVISLTPP